MIGAAQVGQAGPNMEAIAKSRGAAYCVYEIINKVSLIKNRSFHHLCKLGLHLNCV